MASFPGSVASIVVKEPTEWREFDDLREFIHQAEAAREALRGMVLISITNLSNESEVQLERLVDRLHILDKIIERGKELIFNYGRAEEQRYKAQREEREKGNPED